MKNRKTRLWVLIVLLNMGMGISTFAQKIPLVYTVENTGIKNPAPVLPGINELPVVKTLTDPFNGPMAVAVQPTSRTGADGVQR
ncbi:MAG: hypothetical protein ACLVEU_09915 [Bacteroides cellulosilyticus]